MIFFIFTLFCDLFLKGPIRAILPPLIIISFEKPFQKEPRKKESNEDLLEF